MAEIYLNEPQKRSRLTLCKEEYGVWGRGTGKTQGPIADRAIRFANWMPRGATGIVGTTYMQLLDRTLPPLLKAWETLGYYENVHYWVRTRPQDRLNIPRPLYKVLHPEYSIFWWNGHVFHLISQDKPGLANGKTLDAIICDEARFLNHERYVDDIAPINRGNREHFSHLPFHHAVTMYTDMPRDPKGRWILDMREQMDIEGIAEIAMLQYEQNRIIQKMLLPNLRPGQKKYLNRKFNEYQRALNAARLKYPVYYSEASSLDNLAILGEEQILQWRREMLTPVFKAAILNERIILVENSFYHLLDTDYHCYDQYDYSYIEGLGIHLPPGALDDCRKDADLIKGSPIDVAFDYNSKIKTLVAGQDTNRAYRVLKSMYVKREQQKVLTDLVDEFCKYYEPHNCHEVNYFYDNTAMVTDATRLETLAEVVMGQFEANGWKVRGINIGVQPMHMTRYRMWEAILQEKDNRFQPLRINRQNNDSLITSMQSCGVRQGKNGFEKDKRPELNNSVKPEEAPHLTDALDTLYIGKFRFDYGYEMPVTDLLIS